jgi:hypothetical protein
MMRELARLKPLKTWCKAHNFKVGDRVIIVEDEYNREPASYPTLFVGGLVWKMATVTGVNTEKNIVRVKPDHRHTSYLFRAHELYPLTPVEAR